MNQSDTLLTALAVGIGLGAGFWAGAEHGKIGFVGGFLGGIACVFIVFTLVRLPIPERPD